MKWKAAAIGGWLPSRADFVPERMGKDYPNCLLIEIASDLPRSRVIHAGEIVAGSASDGVTDQASLSEYPANSLPRLATAKIGAVLTKRAPITFGGTGVRDATAVLYRAVLVPLADDGKTITHVLAAINFKEISVVEEYSDEVEPKPADTVSAYMAFSSRRLVFAPSAATRKAAGAKLR